MNKAGAICLALLTPFVCSAASPVDRSDVILQRPNLLPSEAMPLGNGQLGLAVWSAGGLTIQLNRADTLPGRLSPGQIVIPGLTALTSASNYGGRLKLHEGEFSQHGSGMTATVYVQPAKDIAVVEVTGAERNIPQSVDLHLWAPRRPEAQFGDNLAVLSESWKDTKAAGASGETFGSLAAVSVDGESPTAAIADNLTVRVTFRPHANGSYRVFIAAPHWTGGNALQTARSLLSDAPAITANTHQLWWHNFWNTAAMFEMASSDGSAEYLENLRMLYLFMAAAERGGALPGSQAGIADLFSPLQDSHKWDPSAYWHFNLRMLVAANLGAGLSELNQPYFNLYRQNLQNIEHWTATHMRGLPGACVPETMRFNGQGFENEDWVKTPGLNCDAASTPYYNARTLSTGAEVSLWIWSQYLATNDRSFLAANYPVMAASARFLLAYSKVGEDGKRHTFPTNAHENQWDVHDSTNDICAMRTLFPELIQAAKVLGKDAALAHQAKLALTQIPDLPGTQIIAQSYTPDAEIHNTENVGLEPVWPYGLIGDSGPQHDLGVRTYQARTNKLVNDWSFDPLQAARLGLASEMKTDLLGLTEKYQTYPSGLASFMGPELYIEQIGVLTATLQEALVQDYDGLLRILPAWPKEWDVTGTAFIQHQSKVTVDFHNGSLSPLAIESNFAGKMQVRNPWLGESIELHDETHLIPVHLTADVLEFTAEKGHRYRLGPAGQTQIPSAPKSHFTEGPRYLGSRSIGLGPTH